MTERQSVVSSSFSRRQHWKLCARIQFGIDNLPATVDVTNGIDDDMQWSFSKLLRYADVSVYSTPPDIRRKMKSVGDNGKGTCGSADSSPSGVWVKVPDIE